MPELDLGRIVPSINGHEADENCNVQLTHMDVNSVAQPETEDDKFTNGALSPWVNYREDLDQLKDTLVNHVYLDFDSVEFEYGAFGGNGSTHFTKQRLISDFLFVKKGTVIGIRDTANYVFYVERYMDSNGIAHKTLVGPVTDPVTVDENCYVRLGIRKNPAVDIGEAEFDVYKAQFAASSFLRPLHTITKHHETDRGVYVTDANGKRTTTYAETKNGMRIAKPIDVENVDYVDVRISFPNGLKSGDGIKVVTYDKDFAVLYKKTFNTDHLGFAIPNGTKYLRLSFYGAGEYSANGTEMHTYLDGAEVTYGTDALDVNEVYDRSESTSYNRLFFTVNGEYLTSGCLKLPPNYTLTGKSVPLIIFIQGSGDYLRMEGTAMSNNYMPYLQYLCDEGFAVFDCYAWTDKYTITDGEDATNPWVIPISIDCYRDAIKYLGSRYNVDCENVFLISKSHGGQMAVALAMHKDFDIRASCLLAPDLDIFEQNGYGYSASARKAIAEELGLEGDIDGVFAVENFNVRSEAGRAFLTQNMKKFSGYNPMWTNTTGNTLTEKFANSIGRVRDKTLCKHCKTPTKIWIAEDDTAVPYAQADELIEQMLNAGSICELRTMPSGTGGHHAVDNDANALKASGVTAQGVTYTDMPLAYVEAVEYMRRFMR